MINDLKNAFNHLSNISKTIQINIISPQNLLDIKENLEELASDIKFLHINVTELQTTKKDIHTTLQELIATLNISLVDILSDIESIHEILVTIGKNYSQYLEKE